MSKEIILPFAELEGRRMDTYRFALSSHRGLLIDSCDACSAHYHEESWAQSTIEEYLELDGRLAALDEAYIELAGAKLVQEAAEAANAEAHAAIGAMATSDPEYWGKTLASRLVDGTGSRTEFSSVKELAAAIAAATFVPYEHESLAEDCKAFCCAIPGFLGVDVIQPFAQYRLEDPKGTGKVSAVLHLAAGVTRRTWVDFSVLVCGVEGGELRAFTFHPGAPIKASQVPAEGRVGKVVSGEEALALGLTHAKVA